MTTFPQIKRLTPPVSQGVSPPVAQSVTPPVYQEAGGTFPPPYGPNDVVIQPAPKSTRNRLGMNMKTAMAMLGWFVFIASVVAFMMGTFNIRVPGGQIGFKQRPAVTETVAPAPKKVDSHSSENLLALIDDYREIAKKNALAKGKDADTKAALDAVLARIRTIVDGIPLDKLPPEALRFKVVR